MQVLSTAENSDCPYPIFMTTRKLRYAHNPDWEIDRIISATMDASSDGCAKGGSN